MTAGCVAFFQGENLIIGPSCQSVSGVFVTGLLLCLHNFTNLVDDVPPPMGEQVMTQYVFMSRLTRERILVLVFQRFYEIGNQT